MALGPIVTLNVQECGLLRHEYFNVIAWGLLVKVVLQMGRRGGDGVGHRDIRRAWGGRGKR